MRGIDRQARISCRELGHGLGHSVESRGLLIRQRLEQHAIDNRKDGGDGTDAERERSDGEGAEGFFAEENAKPGSHSKEYAGLRRKLQKKMAAALTRPAPRPDPPPPPASRVRRKPQTQAA